MNKVEAIKVDIKHMLAKLDPVFNFSRIIDGVCINYTTKDNKVAYTNVYSIYVTDGKLHAKTDLGIVNLEDYLNGYMDEYQEWSCLKRILIRILDENKANNIG